MRGALFVLLAVALGVAGAVTYYLKGSSTVWGLLAVFVGVGIVAGIASLRRNRVGS